MRAAETQFLAASGGDGLGDGGERVQRGRERDRRGRGGIGKAESARRYENY